MTLLALSFITLKLTNVRMWCLCVTYLACEKGAIWTWALCFYHSMFAFVYSALHVLVALWQYSFAPSLSKGFHVLSRQGLQSQAILEGLTCLTGLELWLFLFMTLCSAYSCRPVHLLLSLSVSNSAFILVTFLLWLKTSEGWSQHILVSIEKWGLEACTWRRTCWFNSYVTVAQFFCMYLVHIIWTYLDMISCSQKKQTSSSLYSEWTKELSRGEKFPRIFLLIKFLKC